MQDFDRVRFTTKKQLYDWVAEMKVSEGFGPASYPFNALQLARKHAPRLEILKHDFDVKGLCGMLFHGEVSSRMVLNSRRGIDERNFDCMHELVHFFRHPAGTHTCFSSEYRVKRENRIFEWQANEGAAEALIPYKRFIPHFVRMFEKARSGELQLGSQQVLEKLMLHFGVSQYHVLYRLSTLSYEIEQYMKKVPIDEIEVLSDAQQQRRGIMCRRADELMLSLPAPRNPNANRFVFRTTPLSAEECAKRSWMEKIFYMPSDTDWDYVISTGMYRR